MILELLKYFAKYPTKAGVLNLFKQGESTLSGYADLLSFVNALPANSVMPDIENYVVASDIDSTKQLVSEFVGVPTYLMRLVVSNAEFVTIVLVCDVRYLSDITCR